MRTTVFRVSCAQPGCSIHMESALQREVTDAGWEIYRPAGKGRKYYCPEHRAEGLPDCANCGRRMRKLGARKEDWPDTVARGYGGKCSWCAKAKAQYEGDLDRAVNSYIIKSGRIK